MRGKGRRGKEGKGSMGPASKGRYGKGRERRNKGRREEGEGRAKKGEEEIVPVSMDRDTVGVTKNTSIFGNDVQRECAMPLRT